MYSSSSSSSSSEGSEDAAEENEFKENDPNTTMLRWSGDNNMTDGELEELGRDISNNSHLETVALCRGALDDQKLSCFFRGLTESSSIKNMHLYDNGLSVASVRSMVPFLENANNLTYLNLNNNNIQSEGFTELFRALRYSPIEALSCNNCGIESIEIDNNYFPRHLTILRLNDNIINADGCQEIAKLLQGRNATLSNLNLHNNKVDDEGVAILADALQNNTSLTALFLKDNLMTIEGAKLFLQLVNDVSSIEATLHSNHTLQCIIADYGGDDQDLNEQIQQHTYR